MSLLILQSFHFWRVDEQYQPNAERKDSLEPTRDLCQKTWEVMERYKYHLHC